MESIDSTIEDRWRERVGERGERRREGGRRPRYRDRRRDDGRKTFLTIYPFDGQCTAPSLSLPPSRTRASPPPPPPPLSLALQSAQGRAEVAGKRGPLVRSFGLLRCGKRESN